MYESDVVIQSIAFLPESFVEIAFAEQRDLTAYGALTRTLTVPASVAQHLIDEIIDDARQFIDLGEVSLHPPPTTKAAHRGAESP